MLSQWTMLLSLCQQFDISKVLAVDHWVQNQQFQNKSMANCPVIMKCFYAGCGIWINLSLVMLNWEAGTVTVLSSAFTDSNTVHLAWSSWGMWINNKRMNDFKESHAILPMDTVSCAWSFSSSFTVNVNTSNRQSQPFTSYFNERVNIRP